MRPSLALASRSRRAAAYATAVQNRALLRAADDAWAQKDYGRVQDLLNPMRDALGVTPRRLDFAEKKL